MTVTAGNISYSSTRAAQSIVYDVSEEKKRLFSWLATFRSIAIYMRIYKDLQADSVQDINSLRTVHKYKLSDHTIE